MTHNEKIILARKWVSEYSMQNYFGDITQIVRESIISCIVDAIKDYEQTIKQEIYKKAKLELLDEMMQLVTMEWADGKEKQKEKQWLQSWIDTINKII